MLDSRVPRVEHQQLLEELHWARSIACDLLRDANAADDLVQDLWLEILEQDPKTIRSTRAWIRGVLRHLAFTWRGKAARRRKGEMNGSWKEDLAFDPSPLLEAAEVVRFALAHVSSPFREAVEMRYLQGLEPEEIATRLDMPSATVRSRIHRGLEQMRSAMDGNRPEGGSAWVVPLLPLLRVSSERHIMKAPASTGRVTRHPLRTGLSHGRRRMRMIVAGMLIALTVAVFFMTESSTQPTTTPSMSTTVIPSNVRFEAARTEPLQREMEKTGDSAARVAVSTAAEQQLRHVLSIQVEIAGQDKSIPPRVFVEASRLGDFSTAIPGRRPMRLTPDSAVPFVPVATASGLAGVPFDVAVLEGGTYRVRLSVDGARNVTYYTIAVGVHARVVLDLVDRVELGCNEDSADLHMAVRLDERTPQPCVTMDVMENGRLQKTASGPFILPVTIDAALEGLEGSTSFEVRTPKSEFRSPDVTSLSLIVLEAGESRPIPAVEARSVLIDEMNRRFTTWTRGNAQGRVEVVVPRRQLTRTPHFVHLMADGFDPLMIPVPAEIHRDRAAGPAAQVDAPLRVFMLRTGRRGGGRVICADGTPVTGGTVYVLARGTTSLVGAVNRDGRFVFEPIMNMHSTTNSDFEVVSAVPIEADAVDLLYDDEDSLMHRFTSVTSTAIMRGEWIGTLPATAPSPPRVIDRITRGPVEIRRIRMRPMSPGGVPLATDLFTNFPARRVSQGGVWRFEIESDGYRFVECDIDTDRDDNVIELEPLPIDPVRLILRDERGPVSGVAVKLLTKEGFGHSGQLLRSNADGLIELMPPIGERQISFEIDGSETQQSIGSPLSVESGQTYEIRVVSTLPVPFQAVDTSGREIGDIAVAVFQTNGLPGRRSLLFPRKGRLSLTNEPQRFVIMAPGHEPATIAWNGSEAGGEVTPIRVIMNDGYRLTMRHTTSGTPTRVWIGTLKLIEVYGADVPDAYRPEWDYSADRALDDPARLSLRVSSGRYLLRLQSEGRIGFERTFDVRGDVDLGEIELPE